MNKGELTKANIMLGEYQRKQSALDNLEKGGDVIAIQVSGDAPSPREGVPPPNLVVMLQHSKLPPEVVDGIKQVLQARCDEVAKQLKEMGVELG